MNENIGMAIRLRCHHNLSCVESSITSELNSQLKDDKQSSQEKSESHQCMFVISYCIVDRDTLLKFG